MNNTIYSNRDNFFRGVKNPTVATIQLIQNSYNIPSELRKQTGYVIDFKKEVKGDQVDYSSFSHENGLSFQFEFEKLTTTLELVLGEKKSTIIFLTDLLAALSGIFSATALVMSITEFFIFHSNRLHKNFLEFKRKHSMKRYGAGDILDEVVLQGTEFQNMKSRLVAQDQHFYDDATVQKIYHNKARRRNVVFLPPSDDTYDVQTTVTEYEDNPTSEYIEMEYSRQRLNNDLNEHLIGDDITYNAPLTSRTSYSDIQLLRTPYYSEKDDQL